MALIGNPSGLQFNITYDTSVGSAPAAFVSAITYVANYYAGVFSDPVTINLDVGWGEVAGQPLAAGALAESESYLDGVTYSQLRSALQADAKTADDSTALANLPASNPTGGNLFVSSAEAKALGLIGMTSSIDGYVGFSSSASYTFDPANRGVSGAYDFIGVAEHEVSEVMGRMALLGASLGSISNTFSALDLFRYAAPGTPQLAAGQTAYFSIDGGKTNLNNFNTVPGEDWGDWAASAGNDSYDASATSGVLLPVTASDLTVMDVVGWDRVASPPPPTVSPDGSILTAGGGGSLLTSAGTWTFNTIIAPGRYAILLNGSQVGASPSQELEVSNHGNMYALNSDGSWWEWANSAWNAASDPNPSSKSSPDGSILLGATDDNPVTSSGTWPSSETRGAGGDLILLSGQSVDGGPAAKLANPHANNSSGTRFEWNGAAWDVSPAQQGTLSADLIWPSADSEPELSGAASYQSFSFKDVSAPFGDSRIEVTRSTSSGTEISDTAQGGGRITAVVPTSVVSDNGTNANWGVLEQPPAPHPLYPSF